MSTRVPEETRAFQMRSSDGKSLKGDVVARRSKTPDSSDECESSEATAASDGEQTYPCRELQSCVPQGSVKRAFRKPRLDAQLSRLYGCGDLRPAAKYARTFGRREAGAGTFRRSNGRGDTASTATRSWRKSRGDTATAEHLIRSKKDSWGMKGFTKSQAPNASKEGRDGRCLST